MQQFRKVSKTRTTYSNETHAKNTQRSRCRLAKRDSTETVEWRGQRGTHKVHDAGWLAKRDSRETFEWRGERGTHKGHGAGRNCRAASRWAGWQ